MPPLLCGKSEVLGPNIKWTLSFNITVDTDVTIESGILGYLHKLSFLELQTLMMITFLKGRWSFIVFNVWEKRIRFIGRRHHLFPRHLYLLCYLQNFLGREDGSVTLPATIIRLSSVSRTKYRNGWSTVSFNSPDRAEGFPAETEYWYEGVVDLAGVLYPLIQ